MAPSRTLSSPCGHSARADAQEDVGRKQRAEQHDFRREEQPDAELAVGEPGVGPRLRRCTESPCYARSGSNWGVKSFAAPGTLYSYGPRYTTGSVEEVAVSGRRRRRPLERRRLPRVADRPTAPHLMLQKKLKMNGSWNSPSAHAAKPITMFHFEQARVVRVLHAAVVQPAVHAAQALDEHRHEDDVDADERAPEVDLAEQVVHLPAGHLREPVVDARRTARRSCPARPRSGSGR